MADEKHIPSRYLRFGLPMLLLCLALAVRLGVVRHVENTVAGGGWRETGLLFPDAANIHAAARNLTAGRGFVDESGRHAWRVPGASAWLALWMALGVESIAGLRIAQAILDTLNCLLVFLAGRAFFSRRAGWIAMAVMAFYPLQAYFSALLLSETPTITLLLLALLVQHRLMARRTPGAALLGGLLFGLAALTKASFALLGPLVAAYWLFHGARRTVAWQATGCRTHLLSSLAVPLLLIAGWAAAITPWALRNHERLGAFVPFSTMGGFTLYESNSPRADGGPNFGKIVFPEGTDTLGEVERDRALRAAALEWMKKHPTRVAELAACKFARTWNPVPNWSEARKPFYIIAMTASYIPVMLLAFFGIWKFRHSGPLVWILLLPPVYIAILHTIFMGSVRYRLPVMPCFILLAAGSAGTILAPREKRQPTRSLPR